MKNIDLAKSKCDEARHDIANSVQALMAVSIVLENLQEQVDELVERFGKGLTVCRSKRCTCVERRS